MKTFTQISLVLLVSCAAFSSVAGKKKNIIFIMSDDLGFNDPSFRGNNEIITPNIDALAYQGVTLNRYYTSPLCSPTRAALLTGRYAHHIGMEHEVTWVFQPWGLGLDQKILPQFLKESGYNTHIVGKWHLGIHQKQYWPNARGFDTFYGFHNAHIDYFTRNTTVPPGNYPGEVAFIPGYDFRNNYDVDRSDPGVYLTDLLTNKAINIINQSGDQPFFLYLAHTAMHRGNDDNPLPAKDQDLALYDFITYNPDRRRYAAMVKSLDENVGRLIESLKASGKLDDTLIVFTTDNGGPTMVKLIHPNTASNYPLRGLKGLTWEGGIRVNAMVYASWLPSGVVRNDYFHVTDWLQTLTTLADSNIRVDRVLDGMDLSNMIIKGTGPFRKEVETIDPIYQTTSFIRNDFKLMNSSYAPLNGLLDTWLGTNQNADRLSDSYSDIVLSSKVAVAIGKLNDQRIRNIRAGLKVTCTNKVVTCNVLAAPCLFNIRNDPCERENLADDPNYADIFEDMQNKLSKRVADVAPALNQPTDPLSNPAYHNGIWTWWQENTPAFQTSFGKYAKTW